MHAPLDQHDAQTSWDHRAPGAHTHVSALADLGSPPSVIALILVSALRFATYNRKTVFHPHRVESLCITKRFPLRKCIRTEMFLIQVHYC